MCLALVIEPRIKRMVDIVGALGGLALLLIPMILVSVLVLAKMGRPVLFRQLRTGLKGQPFTLLKFRTMNIGLRRLGGGYGRLALMNCRNYLTYSKGT